MRSDYLPTLTLAQTLNKGLYDKEDMERRKRRLFRGNYGTFVQNKMVTSIMDQTNWQSGDGINFLDLVAADIWGSGIEIFLSSLFNCLQIIQGRIQN